MNPPLALLAGVLTALVPLAASVWLVEAKAVDRPRELARLLVATALSVAFLIAAPWAWLTYWMRPATAVVLAFGVVRSVRRLKRGHQPGASIATTATLMVIGAALIALDAAVIRSSSPTADVIALQFPLRNGTFVVLQGGQSAITNPFHYANAAGRLSLDVVRLGVLGTRSRSPLSYQLSDYLTYGVPVSSPCAGDVVTVVDGLADNPPGKSDVDHPAGNHVVLRCDSDPHVVLLLAHLRSASVLIHAGDRVSADQVLGAVGNSGNTSEPHLHIQATRGDLDSGSAVSMVFDGRFLMANSLIFDDD